MIGNITSYDKTTQTGVIQSEEINYNFHIKAWSESTLPVVGADVLFEEEEEHMASMVTMIGNYTPPQEAVKSRSIAMALALFPATGIFGAHRWYLGFYKIAIFQMLITIATIGIGFLWPFVEGFLLYLGKIHKDKQGRPLK